MNLEERVVELQKAHAFSPRFISKTWEELPKELQEVLTKSNLEESTHGQIGGNRAGVSTKTPFDADEDYEGESDDRDKQTKEEFKHEQQEKPKVEKNNGMEQEAKKKVQNDGMRQDWRPTGGESDKNKGLINKYVAPTNRRVAPRADTMGWQSMIQANAPKKKQPRAVSDESTEYRSTSGKLLGRGAEGKKLQEEDLNKSSWQTWLSLTQKGHNPFKVKGDEHFTSQFEMGNDKEQNIKTIENAAKKKKISDKKRHGTLGTSSTDKFKAGFSKRTNLDLSGSKPNPEVGKLVAAGHEKKRQDKVTRDKKIHGTLGTSSTDKFKALKDWLEAKKMGEITHRDGTVTSYDDKYNDSVNAGFKSHKEQYDKDPKSKPHSFDPSKSPRFDAKTGKYIGEPPHKSDLKHHASVRDHLDSKQREAWRNSKQVKNKEGDGAGNSGINSTDTVGVYNARYSDRKGRYRDQGKDGKQ